MKYLFFFSALFFVLPVTVALLCERLWIRWIMLGLLLPLLVFNQTSINFFSNEFYRGTSRGMEVSFVYIIAFIVLLSLSILRGVRSFLPDWGSRLYLVYFLCCLPSLRNADNFLFSFFELWKMFMIHLVFLAVYHYLEFSSGDFDILLYGLTGVIAVNFCAVVVQHFWGIYQVYGVFPHQNSMAMFMLLSGVLLFSRYFNLSEGEKAVFFSSPSAWRRWRSSAPIPGAHWSVIPSAVWWLCCTPSGTSSPSARSASSSGSPLSA